MSVAKTISERHAERGIGQFIVYVLVVLFFVAAGIHWRAKQHTDRIAVQGATYLPADEVIGMIDSTSADSSVARAKLADMRMQVLKHPFVKTASVQREGTRSIAINITERVPIAVLVSDDGTMHYVDEEYVLMPYRVVQTACDLPLIRGLMKTGLPDSTNLRTIVDLLKETQRRGDGILYKDISEVRFNASSHSVSLATAESGTDIIVGSIDSYHEKIDALLAFYRYAGKQNNARIRSVVDLRWKDRIIIRKNTAQ